MKTEIIQIIGLLLTASTKFLFAPSATISFGFGYWETIIITISGGWIGVLVFYFFGRIVVDLFMRGYFKRKKKNKFTRTNKLIIKVKTNFGIMGLALLTPVLISIPVGSILAARYFGEKKLALYILLASVVFWSFVLTTISFQLKQLM